MHLEATIGGGHVTSVGLGVVDFETMRWKGNPGVEAMPESEDSIEA